MALHGQGKFKEAEPLYVQALEIHKQRRITAHADYANVLFNLALLYTAQKRPQKGLPLARQALELIDKNLEQTAAGQSEREQLVLAADRRNYLDGFLTIAAAAGTPAEEVYPLVLRWKGAVSARQQLVRRMRKMLPPGAQSPAAKRYAELTETTRRLAALTLAPYDPKKQAEHLKEAEELSEKIERLERELAEVSQEFRRGLQQRQRTLADLRRDLPADVVLIDLLEYAQFRPEGGNEKKEARPRRLVAFVVQKGRPTVRVELGPVEPIAGAVDAWRKTFGRRNTSAKANPGDELRRLVWLPLQAHLGSAKTVLLSPDGALNRFPWAALPGKQAGSYLIEEVALAVLPIPRLLPDLLEQPKSATTAEPGLLLVGDVNFDAAPGAVQSVADSRSAPHTDRAGTLLKWPGLAGTRAEVVAIKDSFQRRFRKGRTTELREEEPNEQAVRKQAPRHRFLHFATHGFFAPAEVRSALSPVGSVSTCACQRFSSRGIAGFHPGLLSGLVLAGANRPVNPEQDDGILTALEVAELDLSGVELATLSACETGLGQSAGGEGLLGLQRAFQTAGARSVVASLWKVRDDATRSLMIDFYENLWRKKMPKVEALRQAQLAMLREGIKRGLELLEQPAQKDRRLPPYYWAAFVLSGDWR